MTTTIVTHKFHKFHKFHRRAPVLAWDIGALPGLPGAARRRHRHRATAAELRDMYNDFDIILTPFSLLASTNAVLRCVVYIGCVYCCTSSRAEWRTFGLVVSKLGASGVETQRLWMCLVCGHVGCSRQQYSANLGHVPPGQNGHMLQHWGATHFRHKFAVELDTKFVWDYQRDMYGSFDIILDSL